MIKDRAKYSGDNAPRIIGARKRRQILEWIYDFGYSTEPIIQRAFPNTRKTISLLKNEGYILRSDAVLAKWGATNYGAILTLTEKGLAAALYTSPHEYNYTEIDPDSISRDRIAHNIIVQEIVAMELASGIYAGYLPERYFRTGEHDVQKIPDACLVTVADELISVEIERVPKWNQPLDKMIAGLIKQHAPNTPRHAFAQTIIYLPSERSCERYRKAISPLADLHVWARNHNRVWEVEKIVQVPEWLHEKVSLRATRM